MSVINIANIGGRYPSISPRALPENGAQISTNLLARTPEFRPLHQDLAVATVPVNNPRTLHRLARKADGTFNSDMAAGWISSDRVVNYVKGPLNDDTTDRGYYTYGDGLSPPGTIDTSLVSRQLGVPAPTTAPTGSITLGDEFTPEELAAGLLAAQQAAHDALANNTSIAWLGANHPGTGRPGYIDRASMTADIPDGSQVLRVFRVSSAGGANNGVITNTYSSLTPEQASWIFDPALGGFYATANGTHPAWTGNVNDHYCIPLAVYGRTNILTVASSFALQDVKRPGSVSAGYPDGELLFTGPQVSTIVSAVNALISPTGNTIGPALESLKAKASDVMALIDTGSGGAVKASVAQFYAGVANPAIASASDVLAELIWQKAQAIATAPAPFVAPVYPNNNDR